MKPLQPVALGLLVVALSAPVGGVDLLADPLGWVLVLLGVRDLRHLPQWSVLMALTGAAAAVSVPLCVPAVTRAVDDAEPALAWAVGLPALGATGLLCLALGRVAAARRAGVPGTVLRIGVLLHLVVAALPVLVFGAGVDALRDPAAAVAGLTVLGVVLVTFLYADREWARPAATPGVSDRPAAGSPPDP